MKEKVVVIPFWDMGVGGIQTRIISIIECLLKEKNIKVVLLLKSNVVLQHRIFKHNKFQTICFTQKSITGKRIDFFLWLLWQFFQIRPSIILTYSNRFVIPSVFYAGFMYFFGKKPKLIHSEEIFLSIYIKMYEPWYWKYLIMFFYRKLDVIIVLHNSIKIDLSSIFHIDHNVVVIPTWLSAVGKDVHPVKEKKYDLLYVGRIAQEKRLDRFIAVAEKLYSTDRVKSICIVGDGPMKKSFLALLSRSAVSSITNVHTPAGDISMYYRQAKCLFLPSENEGLPLVVLEAASYRVPSIIWDYPGSHYAVADGKTGYIVTSIEQATKSISLLLRNHTLRKSMAESAHKYVLSFFSIKNRDAFCEVVYKQ